MSFLFEETTFSAYTFEHGIPVFIFFLLTVLSIWYAQSYLDIKQKRNFGILLCFLAIAGVFMRLIYTCNVGLFTIQEELPLHLCRITAFMSPFIIYYRNRFWLGILYFWTIIGTLNAIITPDLPEGFPNLSYFSYWFLHCGLVLLGVYSVIVFKVKIGLRDMKNVFLVTNLYMICVTIVNYMIGSNYFYTLRKPPVASLLDYMGDWPWYLITAQGIVIVLMFVAYLPFVIHRNLFVRTTVL